MGNDVSGGITCLCNRQLRKVRARDAYLNSPGGVICDECRTNIKGNTLVYHCGKNASHPNGYDVCMACVARSPHERKPMVKNQSGSNVGGKDDTESLESLIAMIRILKLLDAATDKTEDDEKDEMKNVAAISPQKQLRRFNCDSIVLTYFLGKNKYYFYSGTKVFSEGFFKKAYRAVMYHSTVTTGAKIGTPRIADGTNVVLKKKYRVQDGWQFKEAKPIMNRDEWATDLSELERLGEYCQEWNKNQYSDKTYEVSKAFVLKVSDEGMSGAGQFTKGEYLLVEPFMPEFEKWNWPNAAEKFAKAYSIQAFGHFTYHYSNGAELVNDAQGYRDDNKYILTDPYYVNGNDPRCEEWFKDHKCNKFCKSSWKRPNNVQRKQLRANFCYAGGNGNNSCIRPTGN